ncbi:MAG TPA: electron transport complex subunit RsxA [Gammaproteobacteria bacterium]|nr:electron transport complex subunit RsxA [Gammaproteobacteria bacterium]
MGEIVLVVIGAALVNNFVLVQFLGLCPLFGASRKIEGAIGMGLATGLVLTLASGLSYLVGRWLLEPFGLEYLRLISFILVIGAAVQLTDVLIRWRSPLLHRVLGLYIPLIASNCAVLGVALLNATAQRSFVVSIVYGAGAAAGFGLVLAMLAGLRERIDENAIAPPLRGSAIALVTAGIMSLAFAGFAGFARL